MSMERDNEMIRKLMIQFRKEVSPGGSVSADSEKEAYHIYLLKNAGFVEYKEFHSMGQKIPEFDEFRITSFGHDFLEAAENDTVWNKSKDFLKKKGEDITKIPLKVLSSILTAQLKNHLGIE